MDFSREDVAWAAGVFEGEGWISKAPNAPHSYRVGVGMTDEDIINRLASIFPLGNLGTSTRGEDHWKQLYTWTFSKGEHVQAFLAMVWPWLGERRKAKAREAILGINQGLGSGVRKLTWEQVREIRQRAKSGGRWSTNGEGHDSLAEEFGVNRVTISDIMCDRTWKEKINE